VSPEVVAALIAAGGAALGGVTGWLAGGRQRAATTELTDRQADDIMTQTAERVVRMLSERIKDLELEVGKLRAMVETGTSRERELIATGEQLRGERDAARVEVASLRAQLAATEAELAETRRRLMEAQLSAAGPAI
jgi:chromosome segregation ATPase